MADPSGPQPSEVAMILQTLLHALESGEVTADRPAERGIVRQIHGALALADEMIPEPDHPPAGI